MNTKEKKEKFTEFYEQYKKIVAVAVYCIIRDQCATQDIVQEAFYRLYRDWDNIDPRFRKAWIFIVARNQALDYKREIKKIMSLDERNIERLGTDGVWIGASRYYADLMAMVKKDLWQHNREWYSIVIDLFERGLSQEEAAEIRGINLICLQKRLYRIRQYLRLKYPGILEEKIELGNCGKYDII